MSSHQQITCLGCNHNQGDNVLWIKEHIVSDVSGTFPSTSLEEVGQVKRMCKCPAENFKLSKSLRQKLIIQHDVLEGTSPRCFLACCRYKNMLG